jgi:hypothetical protein
MKEQTKRFFIAYFFNEAEEDHLMFVADENCDREAELRRIRRGDARDELDAEDIQEFT